MNNFDMRNAHRARNSTFLDIQDITGIQLDIQEEVKVAVDDVKSQLAEFLDTKGYLLQTEIQQDTRETIKMSIEENNANLHAYLNKSFSEMMDTMRTTLQNQFQFAVTQTIQNTVKEEVQNLRGEILEILTDKSITVNPSNNQTSFANTHDPTFQTIPEQIQTTFINPNLQPQNSHLQLNKQNLVKLPTYDGISPWLQYERLFDVIANQNGWSNEVRASHLLSSLRGKSQTIIETLPVSDLTNIKKLKEVLNSRFGEQQFYRVYHQQLQTRVQQQNEDLKTFAEDVDRLSRLAYFDAPESFKDKIACEQFIYGIKDTRIEMTLRLEHYENLNLALQRALEIHAVQNIVNSKETNSTNNQPNNTDSYTINEY